jgi:hypothetical protein
MYVASVLSRCCICCSGHTRMLQVYVFKYFSCFKRMLQVFNLDVAYVAVVIHMLQVYVLNVSSVLKRMLQQMLYATSVHE